MTTALAAKYLSVDEHSLRTIAQAHGVGPVDLKIELVRWRRADLDRIVGSLSMKPPLQQERSPSPAMLTMSDADLDRIAARMQGARPTPDRRAYSVKDAAAACGLSRSTLYCLIKEEQLVPVRIGGRTLIPADQLEALLQVRARG